MWAYNFMLFFRNIILKRILICCFQNIYTCTFLGQILFHWWPFFNVRFLTCLCSVCVQLLICFSIFLNLQVMIMKQFVFLFGAGLVVFLPIYTLKKLRSESHSCLCLVSGCRNSYCILVFHSIKGQWKPWFSTVIVTMTTKLASVPAGDLTRELMKQISQVFKEMADII